MSFNWDSILERYKNDEKVGQLIFVKHIPDTTKAKVVLYVKSCDSGEWKKALTCDGLVGKDGIGKGSRYKAETPRGEYSVTFAFGIKDNPGTNLKYVKINDYIYCCASREYNNKFIDVEDGTWLKVDESNGDVEWVYDEKLKGHDCSPKDDDGERIADYIPQYNYGFMFDYNKNCLYEKGSAFFFHVWGMKAYTAGCISVSEENMETILKNLHFGAKICINEQ